MPYLTFDLGLFYFLFIVFRVISFVNILVLLSSKSFFSNTYFPALNTMVLRHRKLIYDNFPVTRFVIHTTYVTVHRHEKYVAKI